ncbi:MAG: hypothetical protein AAGA56_27020, partial [Myxococcota bacterium]
MPSSRSARRRTGVVSAGRVSQGVMARGARLRRRTPGSPDVADRAIRPTQQLPVGEFVDLLHHPPRLRLDGEEVSANMGFAFAGGGCGDLLEKALDGGPFEPTSFVADQFREGLFVSDFIRRVMTFDAGGKTLSPSGRLLENTLVQPPNDSASLEKRQTILEELTQPELRSKAETLYLALRTLRNHFGDGPATPFETTRRRIDTLAAFRNSVRAMREFAIANSGLKQVGELADAIAATEAYARLLDFLAYEEEMAQVDIRLHVGIDGRIRRFELVQIEEPEANRFYISPWRRWLSRFAMWWRGFGFRRTELVNRWLYLVFEGLRPWLPGMMQLLGQLEVLLAVDGFRKRAEAAGLEVCFPTFSDESPRIEGLFNPLLLTLETEPVPCDIATEAEATTIVTGPNSGGKTRLLQGLGWLHLLAQGGFWAPAKAARIRRASGLFVSLSDETRVDQTEGRLGTELLRIRHLFERARPGALILVDELCSGTNPSEGEEIFWLVLTILKRTPARGIHHHPLPQFRGTARPKARGRFADPELSPGGTRRGAETDLPLRARGGDNLARLADGRPPRGHQRRTARPRAQACLSGVRLERAA